MEQEEPPDDHDAYAAEFENDLATYTALLRLLRRLGWLRGGDGVDDDERKALILREFDDAWSDFHGEEPRLDHWDDGVERGIFVRLGPWPWDRGPIDGDALVPCRGWDRFCRALWNAPEECLGRQGRAGGPVFLAHVPL